MLDGNTIPNGDFDFPGREYRYFYFAERFGWTPAEIDEQPAQLLDWLQAIGDVVDQVKADSYKQ